MTHQEPPCRVEAETRNHYSQMPRTVSPSAWHDTRADVMDDIWNALDDDEFIDRGDVPHVSTPYANYTASQRLADFGSEAINTLLAAADNGGSEEEQKQALFDFVNKFRKELATEYADSKHGG